MQTLLINSYRHKKYNGKNAQEITERILSGDYFMRILKLNLIIKRRYSADKNGEHSAINIKLLISIQFITIVIIFLTIFFRSSFFVFPLRVKFQGQYLL